jgi:hypothetical protein
MHVRSYYDGETELDLLMRVVDTLREELVSVKENQKTLNENIAKVIGFVKRIELHIGNATEENSMDEGNSSQDEDGSENHDENSVSFSNEE